MQPERLRTWQAEVSVLQMEVEDAARYFQHPPPEQMTAQNVINRLTAACQAARAGHPTTEQDLESLYWQAVRALRRLVDLTGAP